MSGTEKNARPFVYDLDPEARGGARIEVQRFDQTHECALAGSHGHRVLELVYFGANGGTHRVGERSWDISAGDLFLISPGEVHNVSGIGDAWGWAVQFSADALGEPGSDLALLSWHANPLLRPFVQPANKDHAHRFSVPEDERTEWSWRLGALDAELGSRRAGYREAARAHLTLILVEVARLAEDGIGGMYARNDPMLAKVFTYIEERYAEPISLKDVAAAANLSPGYLTTAIRERTGRTVVEWISERRMAEARRLLAETDESAENVGARVGYEDPAYFARRFRATYGDTPGAWRHASRSL